jgi:catechol 2,3-dioxygenase-like lactoylglutathione lyase family enzyme
MEQRLSLVTLGVRDLAASRAFYRRLGWTESPPSNEHVAFFQCGGLVFALWSRVALAEDAGSATPGWGFANVSLAHNLRKQGSGRRDAGGGAEGRCGDS